MRRFLIVILSGLLFALPVLSAEDKSWACSEYSSYRDIPGVTDGEIAAIEALREQVDTFTYGVLPSTEAFVDPNGDIGGYAVLFCKWLSGLFGVTFEPVFVAWDDFQPKLASYEVDFVGHMTATEERRKTFFMTTAIAQNVVRTFRLAGSAPLEHAAHGRPLRYAFLEGSGIIDEVASTLTPGTYEIVTVKNFDEAHKVLKSGGADAFFGTNIAGAAFDVYKDVVANNYFPLIYAPVSLATKNPALSPIISVVQKALDDGSLRWLTTLYNLGEREYMKSKLLSQLDPEESLYIKTHSVVPYIAEYDNYPISFYNTYEKEWQGIAIDVLHEVSLLTGLSFERLNDKAEEFSTILKKLDDGEAALITELIHQPEHEGCFIWPKAALLSDSFALISKQDLPNANINEILHMKVGIMEGTAYASLFRGWFAGHEGIVEYETFDAAFDALNRGDVDMVMASQNLLLMLTHFREEVGYKVNIVFDRSYESKFGFNKEEAVLCSIVDKALHLIDTDGISSRWTHKVYDYRTKLAETQRPWYVGTSVLLMCFLTLVAVLFIRSRRAGRRLETLVKERTRDLTLQTTMLTTLFDSIPDIMFIKDSDLRYIHCNKGLLEHYGRSKEEVIGKTDADSLGVTPEKVEEFKQCDLKIMNEGRMSIFEEDLPRGDGTISRVETIESPLILDGTVVGLFGISRDVTKRKEMEEAALAASRSKSAFLANMSHEIRTPMNAIIGMTTIAKNSDDPKKKEYCLDKIDEASRHLLGIINDILDISKIEAEKFELNFSVFSFERMLSNVLNVIKFRVEEKHQDLSISVDSSMPGFILSDEQRLAQVIANLLSNAAKFTPERGSISLFARVLSEENNIFTTQVEVIDNGIGISKEQQQKLFHSFEQADGSIARKFGGTGLGLAISKRIVNLMGGDIWIESDLGAGSKFIFTFKAEKGHDTSSQSDVLPGGLRDSSFEKQPFVEPYLSLEGKSALLAEDVEINREIGLSMLENTGLKIDCAINGQMAVDVFKANHGKYDIILMDVQMPEVDGLEATRRIRELDNDLGVQVPIIAMTANVFREDIEQCVGAAMNDHIGKPIDFDELIRKIEKYLM